jgi:RNA polymerase sigma-70 factor (ECF subfamily)
LDDSKILELFFQRDERALAETEGKYGKACRALALRITQSREDAEECTSDALLSAWNSIPPARPSPLLAYLLRIARNLALNRARYNVAKKRSGNAGSVSEELDELVSGAESVESEVERRELLSEINAFLKALSTEKRVMFVKRYWHYESIEAIARALAKSENSVTVTLSRLRAALRDHLQKRGFEI